MAREKSVKRAKKQSKSRKKRPFFAYPLFFFLLLCVGVFLIAWTFRAGAADVLVGAKVSAPFVTQPAAITNPANGQHFSAIPITVEGTCPANAAYVEIFDNNIMRGTAICGTDSTYNLSADLLTGANSLTARVFNSTDDEGPVSAPITVYYDVPQPPVGGGTQPTGSNSSGPTPASPLNVTTAFVYKGYHAGDNVEWPISISGGTVPYAVSVDWGDGTADLISRSQPGQFDINHVYSSGGGIKNSYTIKVKVSDNAGQQAHLQFFVIVTPLSVAQSNSGIFSKPAPKIADGINWLWIAWPAYVLILLMAVSYRLGEQEELIMLRKKGRLKR